MCKLFPTLSINLLLYMRKKKCLVQNEQLHDYYSQKYMFQVLRHPLPNVFKKLLVVVNQSKGDLSLATFADIQ